MNREIEVHFSHKNYLIEYLPRRNRLTHSMLFEQFEVLMERWQEMEDAYAAQGDKFLKNLPDQEPEVKPTHMV